jgi:hypothetical protein
MQEDKLIDAENLEGQENPINRRRHLRSVFTYPVEFELLSQKGESASFVGYLKDISLGGAGLQIDDPYGRFNISKAENGTLRLMLSIPRGNKVHIFAHIHWVKKVSLKSKDHNMMWNLWEQHYQ